MDKIQSDKFQTPIEIALGIDENGMTTARKLYEFLELAPQHFSRWCKTNITENEFAEEDVDYVRFTIDGETPTGGKIQREDFKLTAHFAKKLSVKGNSAKAEEAREYFTQLEERVKQKVIDRSQLPVTMQIMYAMMDEQAKMTLKQQEQDRKIQVLEQKQDTIIETFKTTADDDNFKTWANRCIVKIAESPKFDKGVGTNSNYAFARNESYDRLKKKWKCNLDDRVSRAKGRALQRNPGISKTELDSINKLTIISADKSLRPVYETVLKEMMIAYCVESNTKINQANAQITMDTAI